jgi:hypothetical protein
MISGNLADVISNGSSFAYDGKDVIYIQISNSGTIQQLDVKKRILDGGSRIPGAMSTTYNGNRMDIITTEDGLKFLYIQQSNGVLVWRTLLFW